MIVLLGMVSPKVQSLDPNCARYTLFMLETLLGVMVYNIKYLYIPFELPFHLVDHLSAITLHVMLSFIHHLFTRVHKLITAMVEYVCADSCLLSTTLTQVHISWHNKCRQILINYKLDVFYQ